MSDSSLETIYNYLRLSERIGTAGQPQPEQFAAIQKAGFELVINLLPTTKALEQEEELVRSLGMDYLQIPVWWDAPEIGDIEQFFAVMKANTAKPVFVHCAANMRASAFMYLYYVLREGVPVEEAALNLQRIWTLNPIWQRFIDRVMTQYQNAEGAE
jgi:protein tyrosine phosphatase (PTP) superfamily phosphohydrolase (DUF442 family)